MNLRVSTSSPTGDAFVRLARPRLDRAYRLAGLLLGNAADAEDAVGDALEAALRAFPTLRDEARFDAWFDRILVNGCRDRLRRRKVVRFVAMDEEAASSADPFAAVLEREAALRPLAILGPDERAIVVLVYWADLSLEAVAERLEIPLGTVKSRLHRALTKLRAAIEPAEVTR